MEPTRRLRSTTETNVVETEAARIVRHPDGYYWRTEAHEVGPFATLDDARADLQAAEATEPAGIEPGETLQEAEAEVGIATWIDPETGEPAEEQRPRIEEH